MRRLEPVVGIFLGAVLLMRGSPTRTIAPSPPPAPSIAITVPPPLVIHIENTIEAPPAAQPPPSADLGCPLVTAIDEPIGARIEPTVVETNEPTATAYAAALAPQLAVKQENRVWVSDDDGRSWSRAFEDHEVMHVAVARDGVVFALAGTELGVRSPGGRTAWRPVAYDQDNPGRHTNLAVVGGEVIAIIGDQIHTSRDDGRTWKHVETEERAWDDTGTAMFTWQGSAYQIDHYHDRCGVSEQHVYRLDGRRVVTADVFHDYYISDEPVLRAISDIDTSWSWKPRCWRTDSSDGLTDCTAKSARRTNLLTAATLSPAEGARTLAVYEHGLVELCDRGARLVYRSFPFDHVDAVDAAGRALVMRGESLLRWSPVHGWRKLKTFASPKPVEQGSD
jgi:hypothetical protein